MDSGWESLEMVSDRGTREHSRDAHARDKSGPRVLREPQRPHGLA